MQVEPVNHQFSRAANAKLMGARLGSDSRSCPANARQLYIQQQHYWWAFSGAVLNNFSRQLILWLPLSRDFVLRTASPKQRSKYPTSKYFGGYRM